MEILITGGTGLIGTALTKALISKGYKVSILSRGVSQKKANEHVRYFQWDVKRNIADPEAFRTADYIIHLAGAGIADRRWSKNYKKEILTSRTESSRLIVESLNNNPHKVQGIVSASAIGYYGEDIAGISFLEDAPAAQDFLGDTCRLWEESIREAPIPVCTLRTGIVFSKYGGAFARFLNPVQKGLAAIPGNGKQVISWIHIDDLCRMYIHALENKLKGPYNAVSPVPVTTRFLILSLAQKVKGNFFISLKIPSLILKLALGESYKEVLKSTTVSSDKIKSTGFTFLYPALESALHELTAS